MAEENIDLASVEISPLSDKKMLRGAFVIADPEFHHLITWLKTVAWYAHQGRVSQTYLAIYKDKKIAYITISNGFLQKKVEGVENLTNYDPQVLLIGKLYVCPEYRAQGVGKKLLNFVSGMAVDLDKMTGCLGLIVDSNSNPQTIDFYKRFGFVEIDKQKDYGEETIKMFFRLSATDVLS